MKKKINKQSTLKQKRSSASLVRDESLKPTEPEQEDTGAANNTSAIPVVGIGGSAGSLEAFKTFFTTMPENSGAAFVVIQHLAPKLKSLLAEILAQHTRMSVVQATDALPVEPNSVYVIPPNKYLQSREGVLFLTEPVKQGAIQLPIDFFFRSLAEDQQERAICILFSGAGSDGTLGVRAIRGAGGLAMAQDPRTAQFGDMPRSAVDTGLVDFVLSPDKMPEAILNYLQHPYVRGGVPATVLEAAGKPGGLQDILSLVLAQKDTDFRGYKKSTIVRRIERRMGLRRSPDMARYYDLLRKDTEEVNELFKDLLINVTSFFRDAEIFEEFREAIVAPLVRTKKSDEPLRVWVAGCASGEEAYSVAILLAEEVSAARKSCPLQIFATDIDEDALEFARMGVYPESIAVDVGHERLSRFFTAKKDHGYQVIDSLRKSVIFAVQNLISDPPFSKLDIISCRNLMIYMNAETQTKLIPLFNFALNIGGYLFLGKSEGIGGRNDLFEIVSKKARIFRRLVPARPIILDAPIQPGRKGVPHPAVLTAVKPPVTAFADIIRQMILSHFAAAVVLVDRKGQILQFHGHTGQYLNMPVAEPSLNLLDIAKEGFFTRLRAAFNKTVQDGKTVILDSVPITRDEGSPFVRVTIAPVPQRSDEAPLVAVIFEDVPRPLAPTAERVQSCESDSAVIQLEDDLRATRQELTATIAEFEASNEELRVSNEEVVSTNEELQSTVEELETSKEELQSVNEELSTVNSQLQDKVERLNTANSNMANFMESTDIATVFLDRDLRIKLFTPATKRVLKLIPSDTGRPINDLSLNLTGFDMLSDARTVATGGGVIEREAEHADGSRYLVRVLPYRTERHELDGVVITFGDITRLRQAEKQTRRLATVTMDSNDAILLFDPKGNIISWNRGARDMYGWSETEALQMTIGDLTPSGKISESTDLFRRLAAGEIISSFETQRIAKDGRILDVWLTATALMDAVGNVVEAFASTERDITERKRTENSLRTAHAELERRAFELDAVNRELEAFAHTVANDLKTPLRSIEGFAGAIMEDYEDKLDDNGKDYIRRVTTATQRMGQLIDAMLSMARLTSGDLHENTVNLSDMASVIARNLQQKEPQRRVEFSIPPNVKIKGDATMLQIVLQNLLDNAWKFTSKHPAARIEFGVTDMDGKAVYFVRDDGAGFDMKYADKLFQPFMRLHTETEYPGLGIGLAITHRIIVRHGGRMWAKGNVEQGATFYFSV